MSYKLYDAEIEYLESTGTQGIDTLVNFRELVTAEIKMSISKSITANSAFFGAYTDVASAPRCQYYITNSQKWATISSANKVSISGVTQNTNVVVGEIYTIRISSTATQASNMNALLFRRNNDKNSYLPIDGMRLYSTKITIGTTLVRDFIPVRVGNIGYMYDKVSGQLFGNSGTGSFVLGPDVAPGRYANEVAFLESWGNQYIDTGIKPSTDTKIELKCLYCKSGAGLTNYGALIGADDRNNAYILNHSAVANFTYGLEFSNNFANPQTRLLTFDSTASPQNMRVYDEGGSLVTTLTCIRGVFDVNQNLYLFAVNRNGTPVYGSNRILYCKIYDGDTLVRDYVPVEYNGIGYMYDKVSGLFFDNQGTGKFLFGSIAKACARSYTRRQLMIEGRKRLPSGYLEVEYIENTSSAYINTGVKAKATHKFEAVVNLSERIVTGIFGAAYTHKPNCALLVRSSMSATRSMLYYGSSYTQCSSMIAQNAKVTIVLDKGALTFNGNAQATRSWGSYGDSTYNVHIFKAADLSGYCKMKLYSFKIWDDDALVHNYVPCINLNNKAGLYDLVTRTFYGSSSSSDFVAGKVIY